MRKVGFATGKLIITGEHSVVYGKLAVAAAVRLGVGVGVRRIRDKRKIKIRSLDFRVERSYSREEVEKRLEWARKLWGEFESQKDVGKLKRIGWGDKLWLPVLAIAVAGEKLGWRGGWEYMIESKIPVGSGMGSSAAVAAAVMRAVGFQAEVRVPDEELVDWVFETEKFVHGTPGGVDNAVVVMGGVVSVWKGKGGVKINKVEVKRKLPEVVLVQSGVPEETTGEMVGLVREKLAKKPEWGERVLGEMDQISRRILEEIVKGKMAGELIRENQKKLEEIGVVGERARGLVDKIEKWGGVAKVCGAGGVVGGSGVVMAMSDELGELEKKLKKEGWQSWRVEFG